MENNKKIGVVITTIGDGSFLDIYKNKAVQEGMVKDLFMIVIPDIKSPESLYKKCQELKEFGINIVCPTIEEQNSFLKDLGKISEIIPYNSDNRRNIGFLMALEAGCDILLSVDDDNLPLEQGEFFRYHQKMIGQEHDLPVVSNDSKWFNICESLEKKPDQTIYARGYPYNRRWKDTDNKVENKKIKVMLNAGLWLNDPDVDSITRISRDIKTINITSDQMALGIGTFSPINSQNTALHVDLLPAYYFVVMGEKVENLVIDRYGDIWSGFFIKKVMDSLGFYASFGNPVANHLRNKHNFFKDLKQELACIIYTDLIAELLENIELEGKNVFDCYQDLSKKLLDKVCSDDKIPEDFKNYIKRLNYCQNIWLEAVRKIKEKAS